MTVDFIKSKSNGNISLHWRQYRDNQTKCPLHVMELFPNWFTTSKILRNDYLIYTALITAYLFVAIIIVCDDYYLPSLERICYRFKISYGVAGPLLLAIAASSPELLISLYVTFLTESNMVIDIITGSAVFNTLAISAICCLLTRADFCIDWWPITRDLLVYNIVILLLAFFMSDDLIRWWEALLLLCVQHYYMGYLCMDAKIQTIARDPAQPCLFECCTTPLYEVKDFLSMEDLQGTEKPFNFLHCPRSWWRKLFWLVSYPWQLIFFLTIPSVRRPCTRDWYALGIFMSICWISALSYLFTWCLAIIGFNLFFPEAVMRLIVLAVGISLPELICGVIASRKEYGSMAICCAFGSNIMDICLCMALPWLIECLYRPTHPTKYAIYFKGEVSPFTIPGILISAMMLYLFVLLKHFEWRPTLGVLCLVEYLVFISMAVLIEQMYSNLFLPHCAPTEF